MLSRAAPTAWRRVAFFPLLRIPDESPLPPWLAAAAAPSPAFGGAAAAANALAKPWQGRGQMRRQKLLE